MTEGLARPTLLVTGASGIAAAAARLHASSGGGVFVISRNDAQCAELAAEITGQGGSCAWSAADLTDEAGAERALDHATGATQRIDGLLAVAGGSGRRFGDGPLHTVPLEGWVETTTRNLHPTFFAVRRILSVMLQQEPDERRRRGAIVIVSSVLAASPSPEHFATHSYAAAKAAQVGLVRSLASYYAPFGIRVNGIAPGLTDTPMASRAAADPAALGFAASKQPLAGGLVSADDVATAGLFLLSPQANAITGQMLAVDGGWSVSGA